MMNPRPTLPIESILSNITTHLSSLAYTSDINLRTRNPAAPTSLANWERTHNLILPTPLRNFLSLSDGVSLTWSVKRPGLPPMPVGWIHVHSLARIVVVEGSEFGPCVLVHECESGRVVVSVSALSVWYIDAAGKYRFLTHSFEAFWRLMVAWLGVYGWLDAVTGSGSGVGWVDVFVAKRAEEARRLRVERIGAPRCIGGSWKYREETIDLKGTMGSGDIGGAIEVEKDQNFCLDELLRLVSGSEEDGKVQGGGTKNEKKLMSSAENVVNKSSKDIRKGSAATHRKLK
ncbi:Tubulin polyglutamylase complex subunit 2 [Nowakowskiella sp. JEL0078]|nr:Tubulin polyglutamylase complex subunit 2 [Nowakowskiella sp. JEL0078]